MTRRDDLVRLRDALASCTEKDWRIDLDVLNAVGSVRRVASIGLTGRTPGGDRYFGPKANQFGRGSTLPPVTRDTASRRKWLSTLDALIAQEDAQDRGMGE